MAPSGLISEDLVPALPVGETLADLIALLPLPVAVSGTDTEGRVILANQAARDLMGVVGAGPSGLRAPEFYFNPADRQRMLDLIIRDGEVNSFEARLKTVQGQELWVLI